MQHMTSCVKRKIEQGWPRYIIADASRTARRVTREYAGQPIRRRYIAEEVIHQLHLIERMERDNRERAWIE